MKRARACFLVFLLIAGYVVQSGAQSGTLGDIESKLYATFKITQITADKTDIVTPGSVLELHKGGLQLHAINAVVPPTYQYKDGRLQMTGGSAWGGLLMGGKDGASATDIPHRTFVPGEKVWITGIKVQQDSVILSVYSDPYNDIRYYGQLKFPYPVKKVVPPAADVMRMIAEVVTPVSMEDTSSQSPAAPVAPPPAAPMQVIAPPPPPADQPPAPPKTVSMGQPRDVVIATLGQPSKDIKLSTKEILVYPDMKVVLVGGKVSDVE